ncbi:hypothetical protein WN55_10952 [Dufourea novaeangliae]|uniref:Uncharacterized protein n=1 Tax=Dufourea novaeangliae TaxID=178035 RepID=A0A154P8H0_DUFNO|nr:hypothetical protein WN55_10952 [Dufourea novaeangliae]
MILVITCKGKKSLIQIKSQGTNYEQLVAKLLKIPALSNNKLVLRHIDHPRDVSTEMISGTGTTDVAIGDVTAEVMITTLGKIPNEMYDIEDATHITKLAAFSDNRQGASDYDNTAEMSKDGNETGYSPVLVALLCALVVILFMCCVTACLIAKSKRKNFFGKPKMECDPGCAGMSQPLLDKISECSNKTNIRK